jgi:hypothetical protein
VFEMDGDKSLVQVPAIAPLGGDGHRARLAEEIHRGCTDEADLLKRLGDL